MKVNRDFKGVWIPREVYLKEELSWTEKILLIEIDSLDGGLGCFATNSYLAEFIGVGDWTISKSISKLTDLGLVMVRFVNSQRRIFSLVKFTKGVVKNPKGGSEKPNLGVVKNPKHSNTVNNTSSNNKEKELLFEKFWVAYDKKVGKSTCRNKFVKLSTKKIEVILSKVDDYVKATPDVKYRKHPATWLNQNGWEDEYQEGIQKNGQGLVINTENGKIIL
jgi:hypothetical protein